MAFLQISQLQYVKSLYFYFIVLLTLFDCYYSFLITAISTIINNLREKFSPGPGIEPGSPALRAGAITTKPPRRSAGPS